MNWKDTLKGLIKWTPDRYNKEGELLCVNNCIRPASEDTIFARMPGKSTKPSDLCQWCSDSLGKREKPPVGYQFYDRNGNPKRSRGQQSFIDRATRNLNEEKENRR